MQLLFMLLLIVLVIIMLLLLLLKIQILLVQKDCAGGRGLLRVLPEGLLHRALVLRRILGGLLSSSHFPPPLPQRGRKRCEARARSAQSPGPIIRLRKGRKETERRGSSCSGSSDACAPHRRRGATGSGGGRSPVRV